MKIETKQMLIALSGAIIVVASLAFFTKGLVFSTPEPTPVVAPIVDQPVVIAPIVKPPVAKSKPKKQKWVPHKRDAPVTPAVKIEPSDVIVVPDVPKLVALAPAAEISISVEVPAAQPSSNELNFSPELEAKIAEFEKKLQDFEERKI